MNSSEIRTLFLTRYIPAPSLGGAALRNWQNINILKNYGQVAIFSVSADRVESTDLPGVEFWHHYQTTNTLSYWEKVQRQLWPLRFFGHPSIDILFERKAANKLREFLKQFKPNIVIIEELWLYYYLNIIKKYPCKIILDNHNIEADLLEQTHGKLKLKLPRLKKIEKNFIEQVDQVWVCSENDKNLLQKLYGNQSKVYSIPNTINVNDYDAIYHKQEQYPSNFDPKTHNILFLGQYNYPPNRLAAKILIEKIYPKLKYNYPDCKLLLVGRNPNPEMLKASQQDSDIIVTGTVPDVRPYLAAASVMIVPLQTGGGTRLKILEALAAGCPVISTQKGAEGLSFNDGVHLIIKDTPEAMIKGVIDLWSDESLAKMLKQKGRKLVESNYSWQAVKEQIGKAIQVLI